MAYIESDLRTCVTITALILSFDFCIFFVPDFLFSESIVPDPDVQPPVSEILGKRFSRCYKG